MKVALLTLLQSDIFNYFTAGPLPITTVTYSVDTCLAATPSVIVRMTNRPMTGCHTQDVLWICIFLLLFKGYIKTTEKQTIIQQYSDWYTGR